MNTDSRREPYASSASLKRDRVVGNPHAVRRQQDEQECYDTDDVYEPPRLHTSTRRYDTGQAVQQAAPRTIMRVQYHKQSIPRCASATDTQDWDSAHVPSPKQQRPDRLHFHWLFYAGNRPHADALRGYLVASCAQLVADLSR